MNARRLIGFGVMALLMVAMAACSGDDPPTTTGAADASGASSTPVSTEPAETAIEETGGDDIALSVTVANFVFQPKTIKVSPGDTIELRNTNPQTPHTFTVPGEDIDVGLDPQSTQTVAIELDQGSYDFICEFHEGQGMSGTLEVG